MHSAVFHAVRLSDGVSTVFQVLEYSISNDGTRVLNFYSATHGHSFLLKMTVIKGVN